MVIGGARSGVWCVPGRQLLRVFFLHITTDVTHSTRYVCVIAWYNELHRRCHLATVWLPPHSGLFQGN